MSHIALLLPELEAGGAQRVMLLLAREFAARGHRVDLLLLRRRGALFGSVPMGVSQVDLGAQTFGLGQVGLLLSGVRGLVAWLERARPDSLLSSITGANLVAALAAGHLQPRSRLVIRQAATVASPANRWRLWAMARLYPRAHAVIALSSHMAEELRVRLGVPPGRIRCIPNPVDAVFVRAQARVALSHPWLDAPDLPVIVSVGRLIPEKDHATLLRAFALLPADLPARLLIVGDGAERLPLQRLAASLGIGERLGLVGFDPNPWRWMARADLFVLSSRCEGHPNSLFEALALGLPTVATAYDRSVYDLATRYGVAVVPSAHPAGLAQAIVRTLSRCREPRNGWVDTVDSAVVAYLAALGVPDSALGQAAIDHEIASATQ